MRDPYLLQSNIVSRVEWLFFISNVIGKGGPSDALLFKLYEAGFIFFSINEGVAADGFFECFEVYERCKI